MAWPEQVATTELDADSDSPLAARPQLFSAATAVNDIIASGGLFNSRSAVTSANVDSNVSYILTAGYATAGDGGGAFYKRSGAEPAHNLKVQSSDGAWWGLVPDSHGYINVRQAGAVGDNVTDDSQAFIDALAGVEDFNSNGTSVAVHGVVVPPGKYYMGATTLEMKHATHLRGSGSGQSGVKPAILRWDANITGIIVHRGGTIGATTEGTPSGAADGSIIEGIKLESDGGTIAGITDDTKGHGIWLRARAVLRDISVESFPGNGVFIRANQGSGGATEGNANLWRIEGARLRLCSQSGLHVNGADTNAGRAFCVDASDNGRAGIFDKSFLGNVYEACHTSGNGTAQKGENGGTDSYYVHYNDGTDKRWIANVAASEADLVATTPGTDPNVWIFVENGASTADIPTWTASQPEGTFFVGGPYVADNNSAKNLFLNCYVENGWPQMIPPSVFIGGEKMHRTKGSPGGISTGTNGISLRGKSIRIGNSDEFSPSREIELRLNRATDEIMSLESDTGGRQSHTWNETEAIWELYKHNGQNSRRPIYLTTADSTETFGRASAPEAGRIIFGQGFWFGGFSDARHMTNDTAEPSSGEWAKGDLIMKRDAAAGGKVGWVCTTGGTAGSTAVFKPFGAIDA